MIVILLLASLVIALVVAGVFTLLVKSALDGVLTRIVGTESARSWNRFALFAIYASGLARGIDTNRLRFDLQNPNNSQGAGSLGAERWILELYRVAEDALAGVMMASITIFVISLIAFVIVRGFEQRREA